ncbi:MAG: hypothetical protein JNM88_20750 [Chitinophagaceae bacterium]|nr:hypothetical protein [Chitinophagaceae bacterium]
MTLKTKLSNLVSDFRQWRSANYTKEQIAENSCDDPSFPAWQAIEDVFEESINSVNFSTLDKDDLKHLLYLIARNWDIGSLLNWYNDNLPFHCLQNDLTEDNLLILAKAAAETEGEEYVDAKSTIAACFKKLGTLSSSAENVLLQLYYQDHEYTKRQALLSLGYFRYANITSLLEKSWMIDDQWHKISCLHIINDYLKDDALLMEYINKATIEDGDELMHYIEKLRSEKKDQ